MITRPDHKTWGKAYYIDTTKAGANVTLVEHEKLIYPLASLVSIENNLSQPGQIYNQFNYCKLVAEFWINAKAPPGGQISNMQVEPNGGLIC